jgi:hypothetical protein
LGRGKGIARRPLRNAVLGRLPEQRQSRDINTAQQELCTAGNLTGVPD